MRWSEWRAKAPFKDSIAPKVLAVVETPSPGSGPSRIPECWVVWGDDPGVRYTSSCRRRAGWSWSTSGSTVPGEGPRAGGKVVRWQRVQVGELAVEIQGGHRLVTFQVETQVLNGADARGRCHRGLRPDLFAAVDGRPAPAPAKATARPRPGRHGGQRPRSGSRAACGQDRSPADRAEGITS